MEVTNTMGAAELLRKYLEDAAPDLVRSMVQSFAEVLMNAEASGLCNAEYGQVTDDRVNSRNGYRHRRWDARAARGARCGRMRARNPVREEGCSRLRFYQRRVSIQVRAAALPLA